MESKFITLEYEEYLNVYRHGKDILNPANRNCYPWSFLWENIGLKYHESLGEGKRKFKIVDHKKWMHHWMLIKINNFS